MVHGHSLTTHQMFVYIYHSKTNEISFITHPLDIAYYVLMYHIPLWFLFSSPCQTWWWPYNKRAETCISFYSYILIKFCCVLTYPPYQLRCCYILLAPASSARIGRPYENLGANCVLHNHSSYCVMTFSISATIIFLFSHKESLLHGLNGNRVRNALWIKTRRRSGTE